jgi:L-seryl-tRNA(Ser) seleniumtransferase
LRAIDALASVTIAEDVAYVGGGSLPDQQMPSWVVAIAARAVSDADLAQRLRTGNPAVVGRLRDGKLVLDVRTVLPHQVDLLVDAVRQASAGG